MPSDVRKGRGKSKQRRRAKRRKLEKLVNWGEADHSEILEVEQYGVEDLIGKVGASLTSMQEVISMRNAVPVKDRIILESENVEEKILQKKKKMEKKSLDPKKKFKFRTRGKLTKVEQKEIKHTHKGGAFDWRTKTDQQKSQDMVLEERLRIQIEREISAELDDLNNVDLGLGVGIRNEPGFQG